MAVHMAAKLDASPYLKKKKKKKNKGGKQYQHSNGTLMVNPLVPASEMTYWAADGVALHGKTVTVFYDADGTKYKKGQ